MFFKSNPKINTSKSKKQILFKSKFLSRLLCKTHT